MIFGTAPVHAGAIVPVTGTTQRRCARGFWGRVMQMHQVRYFLALCEERNFMRAAKRCGVAQPSLSRAIKLLEKEVGGLLFDRKKEGIALSLRGRGLRRHFVIIEQTALDIATISRSEVQPECEGSLSCPRASSCSRSCGAAVWTTCGYATQHYGPKRTWPDLPPTASRLLP